MSQDNTKQCTRCHAEKPIAEYGKNGIYLKTWCKRCCLDYKREHYDATRRSSFDISTIEGEKWLPFPGYDLFYEISNFGRVISIERVIKNGLRIQKKLMKLRTARHGYLLVWLSENGRRKGFSVHRAVAKAFVPNLKDYPEVNHIDGNKLNNHAGNLEWCTRGENIKHAYALGLRKSRKVIKCKI